MALMAKGADAESDQIIIEKDVIQTWMKIWDKAGKKEFLKMLNEESDKNDGTSMLQIRSLFIEFIVAVVDGGIPVDSAVSALKTPVQEDSRLSSVLTDAILILDADIGESEERDARRRDVLCQFVERCHDQKLILDGILRERLELETLENAGVLANAEQYKARFVKLKTKLFYKQQQQGEGQGKQQQYEQGPLSGQEEGPPSHHGLQ